MDIGRIKTSASDSSVVVYSGGVFLSGVTADNKTVAINEQAEQVLMKIDGSMKR